MVGDAARAVSEKRPVGSLRRDKDALLDLMGDESSTPGAAATSSAAAVPAQSAQDLLADIFGSGDSAAATTPAGSAAAKQSDPVNDIMSLFGSTSLSPQSTGPAAPASASASTDLFSVMGTSSSPAAPTPAAPAPAAPAAAASGPQAHEAYNRNGLRITLTPVRDANNRMVVNILAKFEATRPTSGVNFQAAVPKVSCYSLP